MPKVSIIMPACNVEKYLHECMDSVVNQTLKDIEIICMNDGSKDSTGEILDSYAKNDERIKVIHKVNTGYGHSMNVGISHATGEYIGIVETDDFAEPDMFEKLYETAKRYDADVVKSNYYKYVSQPEPQSTFFEVLEPAQKYDEVFCPLEYQSVYTFRPCIWSGIYKREMIMEYGIAFNETPGASYQDTGFAFKIWTCAKRAVLVKDAYLHYRTDNANSSVKSTAKIFCICDEYDAIDKFLEKYPEKSKRLQKMLTRIKYESYRWNYDRLAMELKYHFLMTKLKPFLLEARDKGKLDPTLYSEAQWRRLNKIMDDTEASFRDTCRYIMKHDSVSDLIDSYMYHRPRSEKYDKVLKERDDYRTRLVNLKEKYASLKTDHAELKKEVDNYFPNKVKRKVKKMISSES